MAIPRRPMAARFSARVMPEPMTGCWLWIGAHDRNGYGRFGILNIRDEWRQQFAHRISWELHRGDIPVAMCVCHKCDTPACVNPDHLFLGTQQDNLNDMHSKNRARGNVKLTPEQVRSIKSASSSRGLARALGVNHETVRLIRNGRTWRHV